MEADDVDDGGPLTIALKNLVEGRYWVSVELKESEAGEKEPESEERCQIDDRARCFPPSLVFSPCTFNLTSSSSCRTSRRGDDGAHSVLEDNARELNLCHGAALLFLSSSSFPASYILRLLPPLSSFPACYSFSFTISSTSFPRAHAACSWGPGLYT